MWPSLLGGSAWCSRGLDRKSALRLMARLLQNWGHAAVAPRSGASSRDACGEPPGGLGLDCRDTPRRAVSGCALGDVMRRHTKSSRPKTVISWQFAKGPRALTCRVDAAGLTPSFSVAVLPHWDVTRAIAHTATDPGVFDTGSIAPTSAADAPVLFNTVGTFNYHCTIHPNETATIIVTGSTAPQRRHE
jgi:hypothetical protein